MKGRYHSMVSISNSVGIYVDHLETVLKWYGLAFSEKHKPTTKDKDTFNLMTVIHKDLVRENKEEADYNDD